jgi:hypothetical protein
VQDTARLEAPAPLDNRVDDLVQHILGIANQGRVEERSDGFHGEADRAAAEDHGIVD